MNEYGIRYTKNTNSTVRKVLNLTVEFVFFVYLIPYSFIYLKNTIESGQVSPACGIPMYYVQAAPFVCFIITALRIAQRWFGEWKIVLGKDNKPLEEGNIATVIEEAVVEDEFREKELMETLEKKLEDERKVK